jgi:hypothetical protein
VPSIVKWQALISRHNLIVAYLSSGTSLLPSTKKQLPRSVLIVKLFLGIPEHLRIIVIAFGTQIGYLRMLDSHLKETELQLATDISKWCRRPSTTSTLASLHCFPSGSHSSPVWNPNSTPLWCGVPKPISITNCVANRRVGHRETDNPHISGIMPPKTHASPTKCSAKVQKRRCNSTHC